MNASSYLRIFRAYWRTILAALIIFVVAAAIAFLATPSTYTASTSLYVSSQSADSPTGAYQGTLLSQQRVVSYVELARSPRVLRPVIEVQQLPDTVDSLARRVDVQNVRDSTLLDISVTSNSSSSAATIANGLAQNLVGLVTELERPSNPTATPAVELRIVEVAVPPTTPSSAGLLVFLALGGLLGLAAGVSIALARDFFDTSLKSVQDIEDLIPAPNLGTTIEEDALERPLVFRDEALSPRAEAFRRIRTNLQFVQLDKENRAFSITSPSQGEGKTTVIANLALALADAGSKVVLIDADLRRPRLAPLFGLEEAVGLTSVLLGRTSARAALQVTADSRVSVLASGPIPPNPAELLGSDRFEALVRELREFFDFVLIDTPPVLPVVDGLSVAALVDGTILTSRHGQTTSVQVKQACGALSAVGARLAGTVLTAVPSTGSDRSYYTDYKQATPTSSSSIGTTNAASSGDADALTRPSPRPRQSWSSPRQ